MTRKRRRLYVLAAALLALAGATALVLTALQENIVFFKSPTDLVEKPPAAGQRLRIGGLVEEDSVRRLDGGLRIEFRVTDLTHAVPVSYKGVLPDLFREGQGIIAEGALTEDGVFVASDVLAKHDENYMPPEVADALKKSGQWQDQEDADQ
jgi:cytochrome c-type biogenesis protein CcmE